MPEPQIVKTADADAAGPACCRMAHGSCRRIVGTFLHRLVGRIDAEAAYTRFWCRTSSASRMPWDRMHLFWGDERHVPVTDKDSNQRMTREALLDHVPVPAANIHWVPVGGTPEADAAGYQQDLQTYYGDMVLDMARPLFDVVLLGLGENGHTASLFPGTPSLEEELAWVTAVTTEVPQPRLTLTYPAIACSRQVAFLVAGAGKAPVVKKVLAHDRSQPAARVTSIGQITWFLDEAAAG